jgi:hypothetical protein
VSPLKTCFLFLMLLESVAGAVDLSSSQRLIVACHRVDVSAVVEALRSGADVNARFGEGDVETVFRDPWSLGWPMAGHRWTPLIALASSSKYPAPTQVTQNTVEGLNRAREQQAKIPPEALELRRRDGLTILSILLSHKADIDADDGHGATPLYSAVYEEKTEMAKTLIRFGAKVNTKTGIYIDGTGDTTPLHRACKSAELTKSLLENGADPAAKDTNGKTPIDWAKQHGDPNVLRLYKSR